MRTLSLIAALALTLFVSAPASAEPRGEATRSAEIAVPDPFAVPADRVDSRWEGQRLAQPAHSREGEGRVLNLELKRADGKPAATPPTSERRGLVPPVPELELRGF